ncbi:MAG: proton-conducting transporter membrane subunit [Anaerolineae bacterium]|nr:proton-conducting transporter membrane subunit [Anaerolineae bacterium]
MQYPAFVWLIFLLLGAAPLVYLAGRLARLAPFHSESAARWAALIALLVAWTPLFSAWQQLESGPASFELGSIALRADGLSLLLATVVVMLSTLVVLFSATYLEGETGESKYYAMLVAMTGVIAGLGCAADLFNLWLWFEAMAVTSYLLVAFYRDQPASLEAGVKYLVQSSTGSVLVLIGVALVLANTGTLDLQEIQVSTAAGYPLLLAAGALFAVGFGVKIAMAPMHTWLPDAHSQAPSGISAMLSGVVIEAGLIALLRTLAALAGVTAAWGVLLMAFGVLNMVTGNLMALRQKQVKRMLAYSSLTHVGYMLVGLGVALYAHEVGGASGGFFHLLSHGLMKGLAFLAAGALLYALHAAAGSHEPLTISDLAGAASRYPLAAMALSVALLGLGGLPPLVGFMSKWQIMVAGFATHNFWVEALIAFAALNSVLSLAYYAPVVNALYREQPSAQVAGGATVPVLMQAPLALMMIAVVLLGLWPALVQGMTGAAGAALLAAFGG